jgi:hypothetical protein
VASWDPETNITYAYLHCRAPTAFRCIPLCKEFLKATAKSSLHPLLLPVLVMDLETDSTLLDDMQWAGEITDIESKTQREGLEALELDLPAVVQRLNEASVFLSKIERECDAVLFHLEKAQKMIKDVTNLSSAMATPGEVLMRHTTFLVDSRKNLFMRLQNLQRRSQTRLTLVRFYFESFHNRRLI